MDLNENENIVAIKIFKEDFALALKNNFQVVVPMENADEKLNSDIITRYVNSCLQIELNKSKILKLEYKSSEINEDAIWIYFRMGKIENSTNLRIKNSLLVDLWDDQTNLLIINWKGNENGYRFNRNDMQIEIDLNK
jgi:hypothetical protein